MRERAESIGAQLDLESNPGNGTRIAVLWQASRQSGA
jgi:signal transduction histidine kinase